MSSTELSRPSSEGRNDLPEGRTEVRPYGERADRYQGPDYKAAISGEWGPADPLLHPDPWRPPRLYRFVVWLLRVFLVRLFRVEISGLEHLPEPPYILASNHQRWLDPLFILLAVPRLPMVYSMARRDTVFNAGWKVALVRRVGVFAIQPHEGQLDRVGVASVYHVIARGGIVLIFPEGRYSRGSALRPLKEGVGHFSLQAGVPVVPVTLEGIDRLRLFGRVRVSLGEPIWPEPPRLWDLQRRVAGFVERVREAIERGFERTRPSRPGLLLRLWTWLWRLLTGRRGRSLSGG